MNNIRTNVPEGCLCAGLTYVEYARGCPLHDRPEEKSIEQQRAEQAAKYVADLEVRCLKAEAVVAPLEERLELALERMAAAEQISSTVIYDERIGTVYTVGDVIPENVKSMVSLSCGLIVRRADLWDGPVWRIVGRHTMNYPLITIMADYGPFLAYPDDSDCLEEIAKRLEKLTEAETQLHWLCSIVNVKDNVDVAKTAERIREKVQSLHQTVINCERQLEDMTIDRDRWKAWYEDSYNSYE